MAGVPYHASGRASGQTGQTGETGRHSEQIGDPASSKGPNGKWYGLSRLAL